ncbi:hypothetical protein ACLOJK_017933 [Asimina triloba]
MTSEISREPTRTILPHTRYMPDGAFQRKYCATTKEVLGYDAMLNMPAEHLQALETSSSGYHFVQKILIMYLGCCLSLGCCLKDFARGSGLNAAIHVDTVNHVFIATVDSICFSRIKFDSCICFACRDQRDAMEVAKEAEMEILKAASNVSGVSIQLRLGHPIPQLHELAKQS